MILAKPRPIGAECQEGPSWTASNDRKPHRRKAPRPYSPPCPSGCTINAYVVKDQEANRRFFEDILGIPLVATWCEKSWRAEIGREIAYCHTFFGLADGSALAFFQFADPEDLRADPGREAEDRQPLPHRVEGRRGDLRRAESAGSTRAGERFRETDHGYCKSIYTTTPDGMILEFTCDPADAAEIDAMRRADAHSELARWLAGDHRINNELRHRQSQLNTGLTKS